MLEILWLKGLTRELGFSPKTSIKFYYDNQLVIRLQKL